MKSRDQSRTFRNLERESKKKQLEVVSSNKGRVTFKPQKSTEIVVLVKYLVTTSS